MGTARAQDATWTGTASNNWTTAGNWSAGVPSGTATFTNNGAPTSVSIADTVSINTLEFTAAAPAYSFTIGNAATFTIAAGTSNASAFTPAFTVNTGATLAVGDGGTTEIGSLSGGGTVNIGPADTSALLSITGSSSTTFSGSFAGGGSLELDNGATLTLTGASNGGNIGTIGGSLTLCNCESGGLTISGGSLTVAGSGFGGVQVEGGTLSVINGGTLRVGTSGSPAALLVAGGMLISGPGSSVTVTGGPTGIGIFEQTASLVISNGGVLNSQIGAEIDAFSFDPSLGQPSVIVTGPGSTWNLGGPAGLTVGGGSSGGPGTLNIANGGTVNVNGGGLFVGDNVTGSSVVSVTGPGSVLNIQGGLTIGGPDCGCGSGPLVGTLTVANGAVVNSPDAMGIFTGSTLNLGTGGLSGAIVTPYIVNKGQIVANFTDTLTLAANISDTGSLTKLGSGTLILTGNSSYSGGTTVLGGLINFAMAANFGTGPITVNGGGLQWAAGNTTDISAQLAPLGAAGAIFDTNGNNVAFASALSGSGGLTKVGNGTLTLGGASTYSGGTTINGGTLAVSADNNLGTAAGGLAFGGGTLQLLASFTSARALTLNAAGGTIDTNSNSLTLSQGIAGPGGLTKVGAGTLTLGGVSTYGGGTTVTAGTLQLAPGGSLAATGALAVNGGVFNLNNNNQTVGALSGTGGVIALGSGTLTAGDGSNTTLASVISGTGGFIKQGSGILTLTGASTYTGGTAVNAGTLVVNGSLASNVTVNGGLLRGNGTVGGLVVTGGTVAPGNSIGTLNVNGNFVQGGNSTYQVEVNAAGQSDRINVGSTATINGSTVQVLAQSGTYARNTTYTILNAAGGVSGAYSGVTSNFAFLTPTLAYDANNVFLNLFQNVSAFAAGAQTPNQYAVGTVLDQVNATATGDLNTVLNALSVLSNTQGPAALNAISGQQYADFGTLNVQGGMLFMNAVGQQMALARGSAAGGGQRQALAQACEIESCDAVSPWGAWASALGALGSVAGNGNSSTLTYNFGGAAAGIDYRLDPRFLVGLGTGYTSGTQWVDSFMGRGWSDSVSVVGYGSFTQAAFYTDALAGYAWSGNQMQRQIMIPGLQARTANGSTGANQFLGQVESGYKVGIYAPAFASLTPFGRFQGMSVNQGGFSEWGSANSLNLNVAQQTTTSLRSTFGAELAGAIGLGDTRMLDLALRLGWQHEYADTGRPITAAFAGAPSNAFTVYGATPQRDAAIIGFSASTAVATATSLYLRYDGAIASGNDNHTLNVGVRMTW
jgi:outer membrane autotransporter protein